MQPVVGVVRILLDHFTKQRYRFTVLVLLQLALRQAQFPVVFLRRKKKRLAIRRVCGQIVFSDQVAVADQAVDVSILATQLKCAGKFLLGLGIFFNLNQYHPEIHVSPLEVRKFLDRGTILENSLWIVIGLHVEVAEGKLQRGTALRGDRFLQLDNRLVGVGLDQRNQLFEQIIFIGTNLGFHLGFHPVGRHEPVDKILVVPKLKRLGKTRLRLAKRRQQQTKRGHEAKHGRTRVHRGFPHCCPNKKGWILRTVTGRPSLIAGLNFHFPMTRNTSRVRS